jgi:hypothetical protein
VNYLGELVFRMKSFRTCDADSSAQDRCCMNCVHFGNSPEYLEGAYPGLNIMSSGYASVRKDDGICALHDLYLSASASCVQFSADPEDA